MRTGDLGLAAELPRMHQIGMYVLDSQVCPRMLASSCVLLNRAGY
jgi:hypothetical protein